MNPLVSKSDKSTFGKNLDCSANGFTLYCSTISYKNNATKPPKSNLKSHLKYKGGLKNRQIRTNPFRLIRWLFKNHVTSFFTFVNNGVHFYCLVFTVTFLNAI